MDPECPCMNPPFDHSGFKRKFVGTDEAGGRFADVAVLRCRRCGQRWLDYRFEIEGFSGSGRWYRVPVEKADATRVTATNALASMARFPWHFCGGSYYRSAGMRVDAPLRVEHL